MARIKGKNKVKGWGQPIAKRSSHRMSRAAEGRKLALIMRAL
ncbi:MULTISPECIES: hypothetical protein [unclassified Mesorhizobium]|nr:MULTISPECIES: hypothetical protein [unclassified Mesorhizobium]